MGKKSLVSYQETPQLKPLVRGPRTNNARGNLAELAFLEFPRSHAKSAPLFRIRAKGWETRMPRPLRRIT